MKHLKVSCQLYKIDYHSLTAVCIPFCVYLHKSMMSLAAVCIPFCVYLTNLWYRRNAFSHCCMYTFLCLSTQIYDIDEMHSLTAECIPFCVYLHKSMISTKCILSLLNVYLFAFIYTNQWYRRNAFSHCCMYTLLRLSTQINSIDEMHSVTAECMPFFSFIYTNQWYRRNAFSHCCMYTFLRLSTQINDVDGMHSLTAVCIPFCVYLHKSIVSTKCILSLLNVYLFSFIYTNQ